MIGLSNRMASQPRIAEGRLLLGFMVAAAYMGHVPGHRSLIGRLHFRKYFVAPVPARESRSKARFCQCAIFSRHNNVGRRGSCEQCGNSGKNYLFHGITFLQMRFQGSHPRRSPLSSSATVVSDETPLPFDSLFPAGVFRQFCTSFMSAFGMMSSCGASIRVHAFFEVGLALTETLATGKGESRIKRRSCEQRENGNNNLFHGDQP